MIIIKKTNKETVDPMQYINLNFVVVSVSCIEISPILFQFHSRERSGD